MSDAQPETLVAVTIGPLPAESARSWTATARQTVTELRAQPDLGVPNDVIDDFDRFVLTWDEVANGGETTFEWVGDVDVAKVRRLSSYWVLIANLSRSEQRPAGIEPARPEAQAFYEALVVAIAEVLAVEETDRFGDKLKEVAPAFDRVTESDGAHRPQVATTSVLLVDDTDDIRLLYRIALDSHAEFEVFGEASNGQEAIDALAAGCPDAIVLDVMMPVMDGMTALPRLVERCPHARITVVSAVLTPELREEALAAGATNVVDKQVSLGDIRALLATT